jgi:hypothetical protein
MLTLGRAAVAAMASTYSVMREPRPPAYARRRAARPEQLGANLGNSDDTK